MTNFLKSSEPMPPRLGMVVGVSIMGGIENIAVDELQLSLACSTSCTKIALCYERSIQLPRDTKKTAPGDNTGTVLIYGNATGTAFCPGGVSSHGRYLPYLDAHEDKPLFRLFIHLQG